MDGRCARVRVPASTANLGPGFDTLGMALDLYAEIEMKVSEKTTVRLSGPHLEGVPTDKSNLVYKVAQLVFEQAGVSIPELEISMSSEIPLARGLGSSAAAIVGGMYAANTLIGSPLTDDDLFQLAARLENHPDNIGASLFGGIVVATWDGIRAEYIRLEPHERLEVLVAIPHFHLETSKARHVLPEQIAFKDAVYNVSHVALLTAALCSGRLDMIRHAMRDRLHQTYRANLIPGMAKILAEAEHYGALGAALSGAGPSIMALVDKGVDRERLARFFEQTLKEEKIDCTLLWLTPAKDGVKQLADEAVDMQGQK
jgi:homoserine kinase